MRILILLSIALLLIASCEESPTAPGDRLTNHPSITIEVKEDVIQSSFVNVAITATSTPSDFGGFNLLTTYDASALTFQGATPGSVLEQCGWEYFTYRFGADGNCDGGCPSGLVRLVGIAETNNGPNHPVALCAFEGTLANLSFLVSNDRTLDCQYVPIRFFWFDCGDNTISNESGTLLYIAATVKEFPGDSANLMDLYPDSVMPNSFGPIGCDASETDYVLADIDFINGGVDIVCADSIDDRGDLNLNGLAFTIADAVMFSNYFIEDTLALVYISEPNQYGHVPGYSYSIAASDVNDDGIPLQIADMVFLIQVMTSNALPLYPPIPTVDAFLFITNDGVISIDKQIGAAFLKFDGDITPTLLADNMDMKYGFDGINTRVLIWSVNGNSFTGEFLQTDGDIVLVEMATAEAHLVNLFLPSTELLLEQNQPNPFNDATIIRFAIAESTECRIKIYDLATDNVVATYQETFEAGYTVVRWDATGSSPGEYEFELRAGESVKTIIMTLESTIG